MHVVRICYKNNIDGSIALSNLIVISVLEDFYTQDITKICMYK